VTWRRREQRGHSFVAFGVAQQLEHGGRAVLGGGQVGDLLS
jgi:hypothetical protein